MNYTDLIQLIKNVIIYIEKLLDFDVTLVKKSKIDHLLNIRRFMLINLINIAYNPNKINNYLLEINDAILYENIIQIHKSIKNPRKRTFSEIE